MTAARTQPQGRRRAAGTPGVDQALVTLFIGAMEANDRTTADEAERAQHLIWSTRRFRTRSGDAVGKLIEETRRLVGAGDAAALMERAARAIPRGLRRPASRCWRICCSPMAGSIAGRARSCSGSGRRWR